MTSPPISDFLQFLENPNSFPEPTGDVQLVQTHISVVAITNQYVYKLKKPVKFDFLDFSTLEKRKHFCEEEIRLNRRLSPSIYVGVIPIYLDKGQVCFEKGDTIVDYVVKMHRLREDGMLINQIKDPEFALEIVDRVAKKLLIFYQNLLENGKPNPYGSSESIRHTIEEVAHGFDLMPTLGLPKSSEKIVREYLFGFIDKNADLLEQRMQKGRIVEGHGDLRSEHIHITEQEVNIYDCLEFDEKLRTVDWINDIAFLLMDLDYRHRHDLASRLENTWLSALETESMTYLLTFYKTYRACVRGKVNGLKSAESEVPETIREESRQKARKYYQLALRYALLGSQPTIVLCMGGVACGKSTVAEALAVLFDLPHLNSDIIRKQQSGLDPYIRLADKERSQLYTVERTEQVYATLFTDAKKKIQYSGAVILDATYRNETHLRDLSEACKTNGIHLICLHFTASEQVIIQRLKTRETESSVSDMRLSDYNSGLFTIAYNISEVHPNVLTISTEKPVEVLLTETILPWLSKQSTPPT